MVCPLKLKEQGNKNYTRDKKFEKENRKATASDIYENMTIDFPRSAKAVSPAAAAVTLRDSTNIS